VSVEKKELLLTVRFASEKANPFAELCFQSVLEDMLRGGSVGFLPGRVARETVNGAMKTVIHSPELYEFTLCPVPSDEDSLVRVERRLERSLGAGTAQYSFGRPALADGVTPPTEARQPAATRGHEDTMDEKMKAELERQVAEANKTLEAERAAHRVATERATKAETDLAATKVELDQAKAETAVALAAVATEKSSAAMAHVQFRKLELAPLVGTKISAVEADELAEIAIENPKRYERMLGEAKARAPQVDLTVRADLGAAGVPGGDAAPGEPGTALVNLLNRHAASTPGLLNTAAASGATAAQPSSQGLSSMLQRQATPA
jgi:hypothetical protein